MSLLLAKSSFCVACSSGSPDDDSLEPTSDGDDALPVWFARGHEWANELSDLTRREVQLRLLSSTDAREILRHYEEEPEFREHVNRYIHDFELMMRRVLADRDGSPLGVTILSSDMGKLYVALAQAIERLRR